MEQTRGNEIEGGKTVAKKIIPAKKNAKKPSLRKKPINIPLLLNMKDSYMTRSFKLSKNLDVVVCLRPVFKLRGAHKFQTVMFLTNEDNSVFIEFKQNCLDVLHLSSGVLKSYYQNGGVDFGGLATDHVSVNSSGDPNMLFIFPTQTPQETLSLRESELLELLRLRECIKEYGNASMAVESVAGQIFEFHITNIIDRFWHPCLFFSKIRYDWKAMVRLKTRLFTLMAENKPSVSRIIENEKKDEYFSNPVQTSLMYKVIEEEILANYGLVKK